MPQNDEAVELLLEAEKRKAYRFRQFFAESGPRSRHLYKKHCEFFEAGAVWKERLFMAANRCLGPMSVIETETGERQIAELIGEIAFGVASWDGGGRCSRRASGIFLRGLDRAFRLYLDNGETFDCSLSHRIATDAGWREVGQLIRGAGGQRLWQRAGDSWASYATGAHPDDGRLLSGQDSVAAQVQARADVLAQPQYYDWPVDGAVPRQGRTLFYRDDVHQSNWDDPVQLSALCAMFVGQEPDNAVRYTTIQHLDAGQFPCVSSRGQAGVATSTGLSEKNVRVFLESEAFSMALCLSWHQPLLWGTRIIAVVPLGFLPILDFTVTGTHAYRSRGILSHNCGKSEAGAYEVTCHLTGLYPSWWTGRKFTGPVEVWACGTNSQTTRDIVQAKLLGGVNNPGGGMIPAHLIEKTVTARGLPGALEGATVQHASGGLSVIGLKSYEQGRSSFEGTSKDVIWDDEEPPADVYTEQLYRTLTTKGITLVTFTPLQGMSEVVRGFLEPENDEASKTKMYVQAGWKDVPHLDAAEMQAMKATTPPYQIAARTEGEPSLGSGAIYPISESEIVIPTYAIPSTWRKYYAMDVGWNRTAVLWVAEDPGNGNLVCYDEHYQGQGEPASHAAAVKARGEWMHGVIDPASSGSSQIDGRQLIDVYGKLGLRLEPAVNAVEAGLTQTWNLMVSGRLKIQEHLRNLRGELRKYHRDEHGKIVKQHDHLCDCLRYACISGRQVMRVEPGPGKRLRQEVSLDGAGGWLGF